MHSFSCRLTLLVVLLSRLRAAPNSELPPDFKNLVLENKTAYFEPNEGQADAAFSFVGRASRYSALLQPAGITLVLPENLRRFSLLRLEFASASTSAILEPLDSMQGYSNYFLGNKPAAWRAHVPHYSGLVVREIFPGVNLAYVTSSGNIEYNLELSPYADLSRIRLAVQGGNVQVAPTGDLRIKTPDGEIRQSAPIAYQWDQGVRKAIPVSYVVHRGNLIEFRAGDYDRALPLIIDPTLVYRTSAGGASGQSIAVDGSGSAYVSGNSNSLQFPVQNAFQGALAGAYDVVVAKFNPAGSLVYATYLGGSSDDLSGGIAVDATGNAYVSGQTGSLNFPLSSPIQSLLGGSIDAFVTKLSASGSSLLYSTFLGGTLNDAATGIAIDATGRAYVAGVTHSPDFPVANPLQPALKGLSDAFLSIIAPQAASLQFSTFFGGSSDDSADAVALDSQGVWIGGGTSSTDLPVQSPFQPSYGGQQDGFAAHISAAGSLLFASYLGGTLSDNVHSLAVDVNGNIILFGTSSSWKDFPLLQPIMQANAAGTNCFVTKLSAANSVVFSTFLSGTDTFSCGGVAVDTGGFISVVGTSASDYPVVASLSSGIPQSNVGTFVSRLVPDASSLAFSSFLHASSTQEDGKGIAVDGAGKIYATGDVFPQTMIAAGITDDGVCSYNVSPSAITIPQGGGPATVNVTTNSSCWWNTSPVSVLGSYLTDSSPAGTFTTQFPPHQLSLGTGTVSFTVSSTTIGPDRTATVLVAGRPVVVTQPGFGCSYSLVSSSASFTQASANSSFTVLANSECPATAVSNVAWITIPNSKVLVGAPINYTVASNSGPSRVGTISVAGLTFTVNQSAACNATFSSAGQNYPIAGGGGSVDVLAPAGCVWSVANDNTGLAHISSAANGSGNGTIVYSVSGNSFQFPQTAKFNLSSGATFTITEAGPCTVSLNPPSASFPYTGGPGSVSVTTTGSSCSFAAITSYPITITSSSTISGIGTTTLDYTVAPNGANSVQTGSIAVGYVPFPISEAPAPCSYSLPSSSSNVPITGGAGNVTVIATAGCSWSATSNVSWLVISTVPSGTGTGTVGWAVGPSPGGIPRTGTLTVAGQTFTVTEGTVIARTPRAVVRDANGSIRLSIFGSASLNNSGGSFASDPAAADDTGDNLFATARDNFSSLWVNVFRSNSQTWAGWSYGAGVFQGVPAITVAPNGTAWITARDTYNSYWLNSYSTGGGWGTWLPLYGVFSTDPVITSCADGSVYIVGKDTYNSMWSGRYIPGTGFQNWQFGGGIIQGKPSITCGSDNAVYMVARDMYNSHWMARIAGNTWTGWFFGGALDNADPKIAALGGSVAVVILDPTNVVWRTSFTEGTGNGWQAWTQVGGVLQDYSPAAVNGELYVAGRAPNNDLWWWRLTGNQWTWIGNNGVAAGALAAAPR